MKHVTIEVKTCNSWCDTWVWCKHVTEHVIHVTDDAKHTTRTSNMKLAGKYSFFGSI